MLQTQPLKGFRDFLPEQAIKRQQLIQTIREIFELHGFDPLETPALEYAETLLGKYGNEADKLLYLFEDHGKRSVGLRYDQTVPLSRVVAQYPDLPMPFKRYQIQPVWRAENTQKGRFREFLQCDIDTVGSSSPLADAEIAVCVLAVAQAVRLPSPVLVLNDRTIFDRIGLTTKEIIIIDKLDKIGDEKVREELKLVGGEVSVEKYLQLMDAELTERLVEIIKYLTANGYERGKDFFFNPYLARGLDYYTSTIFELKDSAYPAGSLAGGGRYDKLIGSFSGKDLPAVGVAFGFDRIMDARRELAIETTKKTATAVLITCFDPDTVGIVTETASYLRSARIATEIYLDATVKLERQLKYADKKGIPFVLIIGPEEKAQGVVNLKNLTTRQEMRGVLLEDVAGIIATQSKR